MTPVSVRALPVEIEVPRGANFRGAVAALDKAGVDVGRPKFEWLARALGRTRDVKAGVYVIAEAPTPLRLLDKLTRGDVMQAQVTLVEGWTCGQLRAVLDASPDLRHDTKGLDEMAVLARLQIQEPHPEGLFFPDTYLFARGSSDLAVLRSAYHSMRRHLAAEWEARDQNAPYRSPYEALIMASIIEKETGLAAEREQIGGLLV